VALHACADGQCVCADENLTPPKRQGALDQQDSFEAFQSACEEGFGQKAMRFFNPLRDRQLKQQREMLRDRGKIGIMDGINPSRGTAYGARHHVRIAAIECIEELSEQGIERFSAERANRNLIQRCRTRHCHRVMEHHFSSLA
jgi:hypothetical protein